MDTQDPWPSTRAADAAPPIHYRPPDGYVGDAHPFFHDGVYYLFYLKPPREPRRNGIEGMVSTLATSRDLLTWTEAPVFHRAPPGAGGPALAEALDGPWLISIVRHPATGRFYSFYSRRSGIFLSTSEDLIHWEPSPVNPVLPPRWDRYREWRDGCVGWHETEGRYWMVLTSSLRGEPDDRGGAVGYARSRDLVTWEFEGTLFHPGDVGSPECPEMFHMGRHWYLLASFHTGRAVGKTSYRFAEHPTGPWMSATPASLDGHDLCAGNTLFDGERRLLFGWIPTYGGPEEARGQQWGGDLALPREIYARPDGSLATRIPPDVSRRLRGAARVPAGQPPRSQRGDWALTDAEAVCRSGEGSLLLPGEHAGVDLETGLLLGRDSERAGIALRSPDGSPGFVIAVDRLRQCLTVESEGSGIRLNRLPAHLAADRTLTLRVLHEGDIVEAFLDDQISLAARLSRAVCPAQLRLFTEGGPAAFQRPRVYALRTADTE
jgi:hypothetical protein